MCVLEYLAGFRLVKQVKIVKYVVMMIIVQTQFNRPLHIS